MNRKFIFTLLALLAIAIPASSAFSAKPKDKDKPPPADPPAAKDTDKPKDAGGGDSSKNDARLKQLRDRFKGRYAKILELKKQGIVGETYEGYLDFVKDKKPDAQTLVDEDNADRKELYKLLAEKEGTTPEKVGERNAKRAFEKAAAGEFLKDADGKWSKKS
jgi:uncharacterized protein YdbL (DUF1318 family)